MPIWGVAINATYMLPEVKEGLFIYFLPYNALSIMENMLSSDK
jgi:hypothetical protein